MNKKTSIVIGVLVVGFLCVLGGFLLKKHSNLESESSSSNNGYELSIINEMATQNNYQELNLDSIIPAQEITGNLPENLKGDAKAPVLVFEYADYQCSSCAAMNVQVNNLVKDYNGKVAVVFRTFVLPYHTNGVMAASAANAAAIQGYWSEYANLLFANQNDWSHLAGNELKERLESYFVKVAGEKGSLEQFQSDMASEAVAKKIAFDQGAGKKMDLGGTPWFYLDGKWVDNSGASVTTFIERLRQAIDRKLAENK